MKFRRLMMTLLMFNMLTLSMIPLAWGALDITHPTHGLKAYTPESSGIIIEYDARNNQAGSLQMLTDYLAVYPSGPLQVKIKKYRFRYDLPGAGFQELTVTSSQTRQPLTESVLSRVASLEEAGFIGGYRVARLKLNLRQTVNIGEQASLAGEFTYLELEIPNQSLAGRTLPLPTPGKKMGIEQLLQHLLINYHESESLKGFPLLSGINKADDYPGLPFPGYYDSSLPRLKLTLKTNGIYAITPEMLQEGKLGAALNQPENLKLYHQGKEYPLCQIKGNPGAAKGTPVYYFYGEKGNTIYSDEGVYWLVQGTTQGIRTKESKSSESSNIPLTSFFMEQLKLEENRIPEDYNAMPNGDHWFWEILQGGDTQTYTLQVPGVWRGGLFQPTPSDPELSIGFFGSGESRNNEENRIHVTFNSTTIGYGQWKARTAFTLTTTFPLSLLKEGENQLQITLLNNSTLRPAIELDTIQLDYTRSMGDPKGLLDINQAKLQSEPGQFRFQLPSTNNDILAFSVYTGEKGFSFQRILPVTGLSQFDFSLDTGVFFYAGRPDTFSRPSCQSAPVGETLRVTGKPVDVIYVTHPDFMPEVKRLIDYRQKEGFSCKAVSVMDIYNQFNYGEFNPTAIQQYLQYQAYYNGLPYYLGLVGDANWDYRDRQQTQTPVFVPSYRGPEQSVPNTDAGGNEDFYASVIGSDHYPDIISGRISVSTLSEMSAMVDKIIAQDTASELSPWRIHALIATDDGFEQDGKEAAKTYLPLWMIPDYLFQQNYPYLEHQKFPKGSGRRQVPRGTDALVKKMSEGSPFMCYIGHGGGGVWSHERLFIGGGNLHGSDILRVHNPHRNLFIYTMSCMNGYYDFPNPPWQSITAEEFLRKPEEGTLGMLVPMGKGGTGQHLELGKGMAVSFFQYGNTRQGDAVYQGKLEYLLKTNDYGMAQQYFLMGDPLVNNSLPQGRIQMSVQPGIIKEGDTPTLKVTGIMPDNLQEGWLCFYGFTQEEPEPFFARESVSFKGGKFSYTLKPGTLKDSLVFRAYAWNKTTRMDAAGGIELPVIQKEIEFKWVKPTPFAENTVEIKITNTLPGDWEQLEIKARLAPGKKGKYIFGEKSERFPKGTDTTLKLVLPANLEPGIYELGISLIGLVEGLKYSAQTEFTLIPKIPVKGTLIGWRENDFTLDTRIAYPGRELNFKASLYNYGNTTIESYPFSVSLNSGMTLASGTINQWLPWTERIISTREKIPVDYLLEKAVTESRETLLLELNGKTPYKKSFTIQEAPDLVLNTQNIQYSPVEPEKGESVFFLIPVTNQGGSPAEGITLNGYDSLTVNGSKLMGNAAVYPPARLDKLEPGQTGIMKLRWDPALGTYGIRTLYLVVDPGNNIPDQNRQNQSGYAIVTILQNADLALDKGSVLWEPKDFKVGDVVKVSVLLKNQGEMPAQSVQPWGTNGSKAFDVSFNLKDTQGKSTTVSKLWIPLLAAGQSTTLSTQFTVPAGILSLQIKTDSDNEVLETEEADNNQVTLEFKPGN